MLQFDIKTAFLNGNLSEEIYMEIPQGVKTPADGTVCKLQKTLYGLKQASQEWNSEFDSFLKRFRFIPSKADPCIYNGKFESDRVYLIIYVDDGLILATSRQALNRVLRELQSKFEITHGNVNCYVGIEIIRDMEAKSIFIHQSSYIERILKRFNMLKAKTKEIPADLGVSLTSVEENDTHSDIPYRKAIGRLMFLANLTRPDIALVNYLSRLLSKYNEQHWHAIKNVLRYLKGTSDMGIYYNGSNEDSHLQGFSDADYAGDLDTRRSTSGYLFMLAGGAFTWGSIRQRTVSLNTTEAEYIAACESVKEVLWLKQLLYDCEYKCDIPTINVDNQSAIKLIRNPEFHKRSKHIDVRYHFIREKYINKDVDITYVSSRNQLADIFTKVLSKELFCDIRTRIGMRRVVMDALKRREY